MSQALHNHFDPKTVLLQGSNLVEASAGTGKTYSIAILALRLILEKEIEIQQILMVTFTNAAVAELEDRIRKFIRVAYRAIEKNDAADADIQTVISDAIEAKGREKTMQLLKTAINFLDETAIMTIHGFCQKTLTEFAFETNQIFDSKLITSSDQLLEDETNKFWRRYITRIDKDILLHLVFPEIESEKPTSSGKKKKKDDTEKNVPLSRESIKKVVQSHLSGKEYIYFNCKKDYQNEQDFFDDVRNAGDDFKTALITVYCHAINIITDAVRKYKLAQGILSFDDLISKMHSAITGPSKKELFRQLQIKYKAVFIDEFQDTDRMQYEIFDAAFHENTVLFYIGDPKQSIYAFRSADVFTYFKARSAVDNVYRMNINYRSSTKMIEAMNDFFIPVPDFDMFYFRDETEQDSIEYIPVSSPLNNTKGSLLKSKKDEPGISILRKQNEDELLLLLKHQIIQLLCGDYLIEKDKTQRKIRPSDIGILVKDHNQAKKIKSCLGEIGITAVEISQKKIFGSLQATETLMILEAMQEVNKNNINRALLTSFTNYKPGDFKHLDEEKLIDQFKQYENSWKENGVYVALSQFISDFNIDIELPLDKASNGQRMLSNLHQLMEILHETEYYKKLDPDELIIWLKRQIEEKPEMDEYEQRIESDEDAVKIVTVHSSKGLEYNIVIAPFLEYKINNRKKERIESFRDPETGKYYSGRYCDLSEGQKLLADTQQKQEFRRLIYVAITRAVYKCIIFRSVRNYESALKDLMAGKNISFEVSLQTEEVAVQQYDEKSQTNAIPVILPPVELLIPGNNWRRMSYTMLAAASTYKIEHLKKQSTEEYDRFIFEHLDKGNITGNLLHYIFENISFSDPARWKYAIEAGIKRFAPWKMEAYKEPIHQLLKQVMNVKLTAGHDSFSLSELTDSALLHEMEFDFPVTSFSPQLLTDLSDDSTEIITNYFPEIEGIMNGKVDLFFKHNGKYYILDWKSNFLGGNIEAYNRDGLNIAMNEHNYHLQYLIYTLAVKKFLEFRIPDFDFERDFGGVFYLFIRGIREHSNTGIYYNRPSVNRIERVENILNEARKTAAM